MDRNHVKEVAVEMVKEAGLINLSRRELCERAGIADGSFPYIMGCNFAEFVVELKDEGIAEVVVPVSKSRANPVLRKTQILSVALNLAKERGYQKITRDAIAEKAGVSMGLVSRYFGTMTQLKKEVMRAAVKQEIPEIVAQGLAYGDSHAKKAPEALKSKAVEFLTA